MNNKLAEFTEALPDGCTLLTPGTGFKQGMDSIVERHARLGFDEC